MNIASSPRLDATTIPSEHLLEAITSLRSSVGDALNDDEFTRLVRESALPTEAGFGFLSLCEGFVVFAVPHQDLADWYPNQGWIVPEQEKIARMIAGKYGLSLNEPPDVTSGYFSPGAELPQSHHHLEFCRHQETIIIAHPRYLKIRVFVGKTAVPFAHAARSPLLRSPHLLRDLSGLYHVTNTSS